MIDWPQPGRYVHYKGGIYLLLLVAETHKHNGDLDVLYVPLLPTHGKPVTRPLRRDSRADDSWLDSVEWPDGRSRERFIADGVLSHDELEVLRPLWAENETRAERLRRSIDDLEVSLRLYNILDETGCKTVADTEKLLARPLLWVRKTKAERELRALLKEILG